MRIVFFLQSLSQPRCIKRVLALHEAGHSVEVFGYSRGFYDVNTFPNDIIVVDWGKIASGSHYLIRFIKLIRNVKRVLHNNKTTDVLYYAFGFDFAVILSILKPKAYIYESSDLIYTYLKIKFLSRLLQVIDKNIIRKSYRTVFTSEGFKCYLFPKKSPDNLIIIPNKVSTYFHGKEREVSEYPLAGNLSLRFAYVGAFRYPNTIFRLARIIGEQYPNFSFDFYGDSNLTDMARDMAEKYSNVRYWGKFKSPDDLERIYSNVDIVAACYDTSTVNERIAEPNKLYEAICFCKPIIVSKGTFIEHKVKKLRIGYAIDASSDDSIRNFLDCINSTELNMMSMNEFNLSEDYYLDSAVQIIESVNEYL